MAQYTVMYGTVYCNVAPFTNCNITQITTIQHERLLQCTLHSTLKCTTQSRDMRTLGRGITTQRPAKPKPYIIVKQSLKSLAGALWVSAPRDTIQRA